MMIIVGVIPLFGLEPMLGIGQPIATLALEGACD
jgi:hypothetical protein